MTELPHGWGSEPLSALADRGGLFRDGDWVETKDQDPAGSTRLTQLADIGTGSFRDRSDRWMRPDQVARLNCTLLEPDDVLIARMPDPIGRACVVPLHLGAAVTAVDVSILRIRRPDVHPPYVMWALNSPSRNDAMAVLQSGTTRKRISRKNLGTIRVPVPPIYEQRRIVEILEDHLSRLDAADAYLDASSRRLGSLRRGWLAAHLVPPPGADVRRLNDVLVDSRGGWSRGKRHEDARGRPYLKMNNITGDGRLALSSVVRMLGSEDEYARYSLRTGDVLFNSKNSGDLVGKTAVATRELEGWTFNENIMRIRFADCLLPEFAGIWFQGPMFRTQVRSATSASTNVAAVYLASLREMSIWVPPTDVQVRLAREYDALDQGRYRLALALTSGHSHGDQLRRALLHAAFTGRLTGRDRGADVLVELEDFAAVAQLSQG